MESLPHIIYDSNLQINGLSYCDTIAQSARIGLDETTAAQTEIDTPNRERQLLLLKQERAAQNTEVGCLAGPENVARLAASVRTSTTGTKNSKDLDDRKPPITVGTAPPPYSTVPLEPTPSASSTLSQQPTQSTHLAKLIAIPATSAKTGSPFMRAYPPALTPYGVTRVDFLGFLDDLNRAAVASTPADMLESVGNIISVLPVPGADITGSSLQLTAAGVAFTVSKARTVLCLRKANRELFAPRGLQVQIAKLSALAKMAGIPGVLDPVTGKVDRNVSMLAPILKEAQSQGAHHRWLQALAKWISPLDLTPLPELKRSGNMLGRLHTRASEKQRNKEEQTMLKDREKAYKKAGKTDKKVAKAEKRFEKDMEELDEKQRGVRLKEAVSSTKLEQELGKIEKERSTLIEYMEEATIKAKEQRRKNDKEEKGLWKILWVVVRDIPIVEDPSGPGPRPDVDGLMID